MPAQCSLYASDPGAQVADFSPHWNTREVVANWQTKFWPLCKKASDAGQQSRSGFQFRNPPHFLPNTGDQRWMDGGYGEAKNPYGDDDHLLASAYAETEALLDHLFEHDNTAPFVAYRMIQRLVGSNPTPRYVKAAATAFQTGTYAGKTYSGEC